MVAFVQSGPVRMSYRLIWRTKRFEARVSEAVQTAAESVAESARTYWTNEEWTAERHPEMTGNERDQGYFKVSVKQGNRTRISIGSSAPEAIYEEFGTSHRVAHAPLRRTLDVTAPKLSPALRKALKQR